MLYAAEIIDYNKTDIKEMETIQIEVAKWTLGMNRNASNVAVRAELGWKTIKGEIMKRKIIYWGRIMRMENSRWAKKILMKDIEGRDKSLWLKDITNARDTLEIRDINEILDKKKWKNRTGKKWEEYEEREWKREKDRKISMSWYPKQILK